LALIALVAGTAKCAIGLTAVSPDGRGFVDQASQERFIPFGTNYYDPHTGWVPKIWR